MDRGAGGGPAVVARHVGGDHHPAGVAAASGAHRDAERAADRGVGSRGFDGVRAGDEVAQDAGVGVAAAVVVEGDDVVGRAVAGEQVEIGIHVGDEVDLHLGGRGQGEGVVPGVAAAAVHGDALVGPGAVGVGVGADRRAAGLRTAVGADGQPERARERPVGGGRLDRVGAGRQRALEAGVEIAAAVVVEGDHRTAGLIAGEKVHVGIDRRGEVDLDVGRLGERERVVLRVGPRPVDRRAGGEPASRDRGVLRDGALAGGGCGSRLSEPARQRKSGDKQERRCPAPHDLKSSLFPIAYPKRLTAPRRHPRQGNGGRGPLKIGRGSQWVACEGLWRLCSNKD